MSAVSQSTLACSSQMVPAGHILVSLNWRETLLAQLLSKHTHILLSDGLGVVDFFPSRDAAVIFISEADLISGNGYKRRVVRFRQANTSSRGIVIAQNTPLTRDSFCQLQKFVCIELGLPVLPVQTIEEVAQLLASMVTCETKMNSNPFRVKPKTANNPDASLLTTVTLIPGLGDKRSRQLLEHFGSLQELANATKESLEKVVGPATALSVYKFFHYPVL